MKIDVEELDEVNGSFKHTKVSVTCYTQSEMEAVRFIALNADNLVETSTGMDIGDETRGNIGFLVNLLWCRLFNFDSTSLIRKRRRK